MKNSKSTWLYLNRPDLFVIMFLTITVVLFQNCGKVQFGDSNIEGPTEIAMKTVDASSVTSVPPLKLLFVVDNSGSMANSQGFLANGVDTLINQLVTMNQAGMRIEAQVISTDNQSGNGYGFQPVNQKSYTIKNGIKTYENPSSLSTTFNVNDFYGQEIDVILDQNKYILSANAASNLVNNFKVTLKNRIINAGMNGSDNEKGLCSVLKAIFQNNALFKRGDTAGIIIITDEDDSSAYENCSLKQEGSRFKAHTVLNSAVYRLQTHIAKADVNFRCLRDGVWVQQPSTTNIPPVISDNTSASCSTADRTKLTNYFNSLMLQSNRTCEITNWANCTKAVEAHPHQVQSTTLPNNYQSFCTSPFSINGSQYTNLRDYVTRAFNNSIHFPQNPTCEFVFAMRGVYGTPDTPQVTPLHTLKPEIGNERDIKKIIKNKLDLEFGHRYFVSNIIATSNCSLASNQSVGQNYIDFQSILGNEKSKIHRICTNDYSPAMAELSQFTQEITQNTIYVDLEPSAYVRSVVLIRNGTSRQLAINEFRAVGGSITMNFEVLRDDSFEVYYVRPATNPTQE